MHSLNTPAKHAIQAHVEEEDIIITYIEILKNKIISNPSPRHSTPTGCSCTILQKTDQSSQMTTFKCIHHPSWMLDDLLIVFLTVDNFLLQ